MKRLPAELARPLHSTVTRWLPARSGISSRLRRTCSLDVVEVETWKRLFYVQRLVQNHRSRLVVAQECEPLWFRV